MGKIFLIRVNYVCIDSEMRKAIVEKIKSENRARINQ
jgi:hypothetical protein